MVYVSGGVQSSGVYNPLNCRASLSLLVSGKRDLLSAENGGFLECIIM